MDVRLRVHGVLADPQREDQIAILKGEKGNFILPVWITIAEGNAIRLGLEGIIPERPMSHDLMGSIISSLKLSMDKIVIMEIISGTFTAKIYINNNGKTIIVDSVPGDAIALALRTNSPIYASETLMKTSGARNLDEWLASFKNTGENEYDA